MLFLYVHFIDEVLTFSISRSLFPYIEISFVFLHHCHTYQQRFWTPMSSWLSFNATTSSIIGWSHSRHWTSRSSQHVSIEQCYELTHKPNTNMKTHVQPFDGEQFEQIYTCISVRKDTKGSDKALNTHIKSWGLQHMFPLICPRIIIFWHILALSTAFHRFPPSRKRPWNHQDARAGKAMEATKAEGLLEMLQKLGFDGGFVFCFRLLSFDFLGEFWWFCELFCVFIDYFFQINLGWFLVLFGDCRWFSGIFLMPLVTLCN